MCGFTILYNTSKDFNKKDMKELLLLNKHRGPDETTIIEKKDFIIGFNRLSINNINNGHQPFYSKKNNLLICFNGEFFNYQEEIKKTFNNKIKVKSEVEAIYYLYIELGIKFVKKIRGFFSIAIIEINKRKVFFMNDKYGIKPLYYGKLINKEYFITSDYSPLIKKGLISKNLDYKGIQNYLSRGNLNFNTVFKEIKRLKAATYGTINNKIILKKYWSAKFENKEYKISDLDKVLEETVNLWKLSESNLSLSLSDGVDSLLIHKYLKKLGVKFNSYTKRFNYKSINFKKDGIKTKLINFDIKKSFMYLNKYFDNSSIPLNNASDLTLFFIYDEISKNKKIKVNFVGEGADEIFGGYDRYKLFVSNRKQYLKNIYKNENKLFSIFKYFTKNKDQHKKIKTKNDLLKFDQENWVPSVVMRHDLIGMLFSIEARPIFLDGKIVDFANSVSSSKKYTKTQSKIFLKELADKYKINYIKTKKGTPNYFNTVFEDDRFQNEFKKVLRTKSMTSIFDIDLNLKNISSNDYILNWRMYNLAKII